MAGFDNGDIPLSAVITSEPKSDYSPPVLPIDTNGESGVIRQHEGPTLTGLGPLMSTNKLVLKQKIRACDILSACTGCEVNRYI